LIKYRLKLNMERPYKRQKMEVKMEELQPQQLPPWDYGYVPACNNDSCCDDQVCRKQSRQLIQLQETLKEKDREIERLRAKMQLQEGNISVSLSTWRTLIRRSNWLTRFRLELGAHYQVGAYNEDQLPSSCALELIDQIRSEVIDRIKIEE
jgi:hypothetical protein